LKPALHLLEYLLLKGSLFPVKLASREKALSIAGSIGRFFYRRIPRLHEVSEKNLKLAGYPRELGEKSFSNFVRYAVDFFKSESYSPNYLLGLFHPLPMEKLPKGGGILLTAHLGNWELMGAVFSVFGGNKLSVIAKPLKNPFVNRLINRIRNRWKIEVISTKNPVEAIRLLKRTDRYLGILLDQRCAPSEGYAVKFFGKRAYTHKGPAFMSLKTGKPVIPAFCYEENGKYKIEVFEPIYPESKDPEELTAMYSEAIERAIRKRPEQWMWFHNRWKNSPDLRV